MELDLKKPTLHKARSFIKTVCFINLLAINGNGLFEKHFKDTLHWYPYVTDPFLAAE